MSALQYEDLSKEKKIENLDFLTDSISTINKWSDATDKPYYLERSKILLSTTLIATEGALNIILESNSSRDLREYAKEFFKHQKKLIIFNQKNLTYQENNPAYKSHWLW